MKIRQIKLQIYPNSSRKKKRKKRGKNYFVREQGKLQTNSKFIANVKIKERKSKKRK